MICKKFETLNHREKIEFIGKLVHAVQSSDFYFCEAEKMIENAEQSGILTDVVILPIQNQISDENNQDGVLS